MEGDSELNHRENENVSVAIVISANGAERTVRGNAEFGPGNDGRKALRVFVEPDEGNACLVIEEEAWERLEPGTDHDCDYLLKIESPFSSSSTG